MITWISYLLCSLLLCTHIAMAQSPENGFSFVRNRKTIRLPFKMVNNLIILPVFINGSDTLRFILDTGIRVSLLTSLGANDSLALHTVKRVTIQGWGEGTSLSALQTFGNTFDFSGLYVGKSIEMYILEQDVFNLSSKLGMKIDGLIGYDFFKDCIVEINYDKQVLHLHNPKKFKRSKLKGYKHPFILENGKPYINVCVIQDDSTAIASKLVVDTGASHALSLDRTMNPEIKLPAKTISSYLGRGISGDIRGKIGRINALQIGTFQLTDLTASYPDSLYVKNIVGLSQRHGNLGAEVLRRFHVCFDYAQQQMILRPSRRYKEPFYYNMSGIDLYTPFPNLPYYIISDIADNSPAQQVGLQPNDQLLYINGVSVGEYKLDDIIELFNSKPGKKITLTIKRNGTAVKKTIVLKRPI